MCFKKDEKLKEKKINKAIIIISEDKPGHKNNKSKKESNKDQEKLNSPWLPYSSNKAKLSKIYKLTKTP